MRQDAGDAGRGRDAAAHGINVITSRWTFFVGAAILAIGMLLAAGAPLVPITLGIAGAAIIHWRVQEP